MIDMERMRFILAGVLVWISTSLVAQSLFNEKELISNLKYLSSDSLQGRKTGTPGNAIARTFVQRQFKKLGLRHN